MIRNLEGSKVEIKTFAAEDNVQQKNDYSILDVISFGYLDILIMDYLILKNIICIDRGTNSILWRIEDPKQVFKTRRNYWTEIQKDPDHEDRVIAISIDRYFASFSIQNGHLFWGRDPRGPDFRDF